jgi:hypothetical protein
MPSWDSRCFVGPVQSMARRGLDQFLLRAGTIARVLLQLYYPLLERLHFEHTCWYGVNNASLNVSC